MSSIPASFGWVSDQVTSAHYRRLVRPSDLVAYQVRLEQSDLHISAMRRAPSEALGLIRDARLQITDYIAQHTEFQASLRPLPADPSAPSVVAAMLEASLQAGVGPMASVAGAIAEHVGRGLTQDGEEIIVENGGDVFLRSWRRREIAVLAENTRLGGLRIVVPEAPTGIGLATSAGTLGPSQSFGRTDAVSILARTSALADALATAVGNIVQEADDIGPALEAARKCGAAGAIIIADGHFGLWGALQLAD